MVGSWPGGSLDGWWAVRPLDSSRLHRLGIQARFPGCALTALPVGLGPASLLYPPSNLRTMLTYAIHVMTSSARIHVRTLHDTRRNALQRLRFIREAPCCIICNVPTRMPAKSSSSCRHEGLYGVHFVLGRGRGARQMRVPENSCQLLETSKELTGICNNFWRLPAFVQTLADPNPNIFRNHVNVDALSAGRYSSILMV